VQSPELNGENIRNILNILGLGEILHMLHGLLDLVANHRFPTDILITSRINGDRKKVFQSTANKN
jgi:hypothetical protein